MSKKLGIPRNTLEDKILSQKNKTRFNNDKNCTRSQKKLKYFVQLYITHQRKAVVQKVKFKQ